MTEMEKLMDESDLVVRPYVNGGNRYDLIHPEEGPIATLSIFIDGVTPNLNGDEFVLNHDMNIYINWINRQKHLIRTAHNAVSYGHVNGQPVYRVEAC